MDVLLQQYRAAEAMQKPRAKDNAVFLDDSPEARGLELSGRFQNVPAAQMSQPAGNSGSRSNTESWSVDSRWGSFVEILPWSFRYP